MGAVTPCGFSQHAIIANLRKSKQLPLLKLLTMAPTTRSQRSQIAPKTPQTSRIKKTEFSTKRQFKFFLHHEATVGAASFASICRDVEITTPCGRKWLKQRDKFGDLALHKTRKLSNNLGPPKKASKEEIQAIIDPDQNPIRDQKLQAQITFLQINLKKRQVRHRLKTDTNNGGIYKAAYATKEILKKNLEERVDYGKHWGPSTLSYHWQRVIFTDEAHMDPSSSKAPTIAREQGKRYAPENIVVRAPKSGSRFHVAAWISWWGKCKELLFYNDEEDHEEQPPMPPRPRRRPTTETEEEYKARLIEWEALRPHKVTISVGGNHMTQKYYVETLLPHYIDAIQFHRIYRNKGINWLLQEDGDPSHGIKKQGLAREVKDANWITNLIHPAQSPDLNPIEGIWNIIKQRLEYRIFYNDEEFKIAIQEEWDRITLEDIRKCIRDMPRRCDLLIKTGGQPIKSALW